MAAKINRIQLTSELNFRFDEAIVSSDKKAMKIITDLTRKMNEIFDRTENFDDEVTMSTEEFCSAIVLALSLK